MRKSSQLRWEKLVESRLRMSSLHSSSTRHCILTTIVLTTQVHAMRVVIVISHNSSNSKNDSGRNVISHIPLDLSIGFNTCLSKAKSSNRFIEVPEFIDFNLSCCQGHSEHY